MKTFFITAALSAFSFISANGQEVARFSDFGIVPSTLTSNGKATAVGFNEKEGTHTANILDDNLKTVRQFNLKTESRVSRYYSEITTVMPSGVEIVSYSAHEFKPDGETLTATDLNSMIQTLSNSFYEEFHGFTDSKGRISCWTSDIASFYYPRWFDEKYPERYFAIIDGVINVIYVDYNLTINQSDIDNAQWEYLDGDEAPDTYTETAERFEVYDYDTNIYCDATVPLTQTLFNDDDKWEYVLPQYGPTEKTVSDYEPWDENENGMILRRTIEESQPQTGWAIYNEDGNKIASLEASNSYFETVYKFAGNIYILNYENDEDVVYKYDPQLTSIEEVSRSKSKASVVKVNGHSFRVDTDGQNVDEAVLVDMAGRKVASSRSMDGESLTINATNMPKGVYNVALKNKGKVAGAQKIIIR